MSKIVHLLDEDELKNMELKIQLAIIQEFEAFMKKHIDKNTPLELIRAFKEETIVTVHGEEYLKELQHQDNSNEEELEIVEEVEEFPTFDVVETLDEVVEESPAQDYLEETEVEELEDIEEPHAGEILPDENVEVEEEVVVDLHSEFEMPGEASDEPLDEDEISVLPEGERLINLEAAQRAKEEAEAARNDVSIPSVTDFLESENALPLQAPETEQPLVSRRKPYKGLNEDLANLEDLH